MIQAALGKKLCLGQLQLKKTLGALLDKNKLQAALDKKLCLERLQLKKQLGTALDKNMLDLHSMKSYAWSGHR